MPELWLSNDKDHEEEEGGYVGEPGNNAGLWKSLKIISFCGLAGLHEGLIWI